MEEIILQFDETFKIHDPIYQINTAISICNELLTTERNSRYDELYKELEDFNLILRRNVSFDPDFYKNETELFIGIINKCNTIIHSTNQNKLINIINFHLLYNYILLLI
jgi:hypothetical protein